MSENDLREKLSQAEQQIKFLNTLNNTLQLRTEDLEKIRKDLEEKIHKSQTSSIEIQQEKKLLEHIKNKLSNNQQQAKTNEMEIILNLFRNLKQISFSLLSILTKIEDGKIMKILEELESQEKIVLVGETKEPICNVCSFRLESHFSCPKCKSISFDDDEVLEHYPCSNISRRTSYKNDICPQCKKQIKALGVDYRIHSNVYFCNQCNEKFQRPLMTLICRKCNATHTVENTKWTSSNSYRLSYKS